MSYPWNRQKSTELSAGVSEVLPFNRQCRRTTRIYCLVPDRWRDCDRDERFSSPYRPHGQIGLTIVREGSLDKIKMKGAGWQSWWGKDREIRRISTKRMNPVRFQACWRTYQTTGKPTWKRIVPRRSLMSLVSSVTILLARRKGAGPIVLAVISTSPCSHCSRVLTPILAYRFCLLSIRCTRRPTSIVCTSSSKSCRGTTFICRRRCKRWRKRSPSKWRTNCSTDTIQFPSITFWQN